MSVHYYLSVFPTEALISSMLEPLEFGRYMTIGSGNGSREPIMFAEIEPGFGSDFDWEYAKQRTVPHEDGAPKHSVWLSVYRTLERVPVSSLGALYLTTADGRSLKLERQNYEAWEGAKPFFVYQELCPVQPLVVSRLNPAEFAGFMTSTDNKIGVPTLCFADLKVINFDNLEVTGNVGRMYDKNLDHLKQCILSVTRESEKSTKNVERSEDSFSYQIIAHGVFIGDGKNLVEYKMKTVEELRQHHYDWGRSAMIL